jgi:cell wall-associated NlpC family hydrolase
VPSYVSDVVELPASTTLSASSTPVVSRKFKTRLAALALAGAAAVSVSACGAPGGGSSQAVAIAAAHAGEPYVYGAAGPNAFDCSGFTQYVYSQLGVSLPRTAAEQQAAVTPVSQSAARPGDLIFIGSPAYHVAIYAGNGQIWTAPKPGDVVKLEPIWDSSWTAGRP